MAKTQGLWSALYILLAVIPLYQQETVGQVVRITEYKSFKKLLRSKSNILCIFAESAKALSKEMATMESVAKQVKGEGTVAFVDCGDNGRLCKRLDAKSPFVIKHYVKGKFVKEFNGPLALQPMLRFILWNDYELPEGFVELHEKGGFEKLLKNDKKPMLVVFHGPLSDLWLYFKPMFVAAAKIMKDKYTFVAINLDDYTQRPLKQLYNIKDYPTIYYFENGTLQFQYGGKISQAGLLEWLKSPFAKTWDEDWKREGSVVVHVRNTTFSHFINKQSSVIVFFYEQSCKPCMDMKPALEGAAQQILDDGTGAVAAVNIETSKYLLHHYTSVNILPCVLYFKDGQYAYEVMERSKEELVEFMKNPHPKRQWKDEDTTLLHLTGDTFKSSLRERRHVLLISYVPSSDDFKKVKSEFIAAATNFQKESEVTFAAIDCSEHTDTCVANKLITMVEVNYFKFGMDREKFLTTKEAEAFVHFLSSRISQDSDEHWKDVEGKEYVHQLTEATFDDFIQKHNSVLVLFYALWCSHCKTMMPAYGEAAALLEKEGHVGKLAAVDATLVTKIASRYRLKAFPERVRRFGEDTYIVIKRRHGKLFFIVDDQMPRTTENLVSIVKNPKDHKPKPAAPRVVEKKWSEVAPDINFLTTSTFDAFIENEKSVLVMFYSPTCRHSVSMKAPYESAAAKLKTELPSAKLAAVDATVEKDLLKKFSITGFPTIKYFQDGKLQYDFSGNRTEEGIIGFLKSPKAPPVRSAKEPDWNSVASAVNHLTKDTYSEFIEKHGEVLVMFYAPWCKNSKKARPDFQSAADEMKDNLEMAFAAVDCTKNNVVCKKAGAKKYPSIKLFVNGEFSLDFDRDRTKDEFVNFMKNSKLIKKDEL